MKRVSTLLSLIGILLTPFTTFAAATAGTSSLPSLLAIVQHKTPDGLSSCFDHYAFGSTPVSLSPSLTQVAAGAPIAFSGTITNNNAYPIVDATVYVKIFRLPDTSSAQNITDGPDVVDWFPVPGTVTLNAKQSLPISFNWNVPRDAESGDYQAAVYVASSDRFNLFGLTFTDDVVGSLTPFQVVVGQDGAVSFDKTSATVNGMPYLFASFPPRVSSTSSVAIDANIVNSTNLPANATLTWDLYAWDSVTPNSQIDEKTQQVIIAPGSATRVSYTATDTSHAVYYLVGTLTEGKSKSVIGVRFVRNGIDVSRLSFAAVDSYPLTSVSQVFACAHDTNSGEATSTLTVQIVPTDPVERIFDNLFGLTPLISYSGPIPEQQVALARQIKAEPSSFDVVASLYQNGRLIDQATVPYRCSQLGAPCNFSYTAISIVLGIVILIVLLLLFVLLRRQRSSSTLTTPSTP